jgi:hypothetical protein
VIRDKKRLLTNLFKRWTIPSLLILFPILLILTKTYIISRSNYQKTDKSSPLSQKDLDNLENSVSNYSLINNFSDKSLSLLIKKANRQRDINSQKELEILIAARNGILASRSSFQPNRKSLLKIEKRITLNLAKSPKREKIPLSKLNSKKTIQNSPLARLGSTFFLLAWIFFVIMFIFKAIRKDLTLIKRSGIYWGSGFFMSFTIWVICLVLV